MRHKHVVCEHLNDCVALEKLYNQLKKLPFFAKVQAQISLEEFKDVSTPEGFFNAFVEVLLFDEQLQLPQLPKALIPFFNDETEQELTSFHAQLEEAIAVIDSKGPVHLHFTISKDDGAPDSFFSLEESELKLMIDGIREIEKSFGVSKKILTKSIKDMSKGQRSYYALGTFEKGTLIKKNMLKAMRPSVKNSLSVDQYFDILNRKRLKKKLKKDFPVMKYHI